jgi:DNA-binding transcriptional MerR regulator
MDARAVSKAAGVPINTLNVWVARGFVPGMTIGARGRQRDFDLKTAINVALIAALTRLGLGTAAASKFVRNRGHHKRLMLLSNLSVLTEEGDEAAEIPPQELIRFGFDTDAELPGILKILQGGGVIPAVYAIVNVEHIAAKMQRAHEEWERRNRGQGSA